MARPEIDWAFGSGIVGEVGGLNGTVPIESRRLESSRNQVRLVELYRSSSQTGVGPADDWFASLRWQPGLWSGIVPVAFDIDRQPRFRRRLDAYAAAWRVPCIRLPSLAVAGALQPVGLVPPPSPGQFGVLSADCEGSGLGGAWELNFSPEFEAGLGPFTVHGVLLANGDVTSQYLPREFSAVSLAESAMKCVRGQQTATLFLPTPEFSAHAWSVAFWVTRMGDLTPLQAIGCDLVSRADF